MKKFSNGMIVFLSLVFGFLSCSSNDLTEDYGASESKTGKPVFVLDESTWSVQSDMVRALGNDCYEINVRVYHHYQGNTYLVANSNVLVGTCPKSSNAAFERNENCDSGVLQNGDRVIYDLKGSTQGRYTKFDENKPRDNTIALKDLDFLK